MAARMYAPISGRGPTPIFRQPDESYEVKHDRDTSQLTIRKW
ncbi:hypothetical protein [Scytonema millei]|nr:hypothetical protein [Scytonema millei]